MTCAAALRPLLGLFAAAVLVACGVGDSSPSRGSASAENSRAEAEIRAFLERYFSTWSAQDMDGYAACFHEQARISFVQADGRVTSDTRSDFLHGQRLAHQTSPERMTEVADQIDLEFDQRAALARVRWTLAKGAQKTTGIDHFSLVRTAQGWKIVHLLFYTD